MSRPRPAVTAAGLRAAALTYVDRYGGTRQRVRRVLVRRVDRSIAEHGGDRAALLTIVDGILDELERRRVIDDDAYARSKAQALVRRGVSSRGVRAKLAGLGIGGERARAGLDEVRALGVDPDWAAACAFVRKRRLGPYRGEAAAAHRDADLARLARAGFSWSVARAVLALPSTDEVEAALLR